jgi:hypothetical protein
MHGRQILFCMEERRRTLLHSLGDRFGVRWSDDPSQKRVEQGIEYDLCVITP